MSCCETVPASAVGVCGSCGRKGVAVAVITVKALLNAEGLRRGIPGAPRFCDAPECPVVYFDEVSDRRVTEDELTVAVHAKHPGDENVPVCYCFSYNASMVAAATDQLVSAAVRSEVEAGHCACEVKNPKGTCCLGDIIRIERANRSDENVRKTKDPESPGVPHASGAEGAR